MHGSPAIIGSPYGAPSMPIIGAPSGPGPALQLPSEAIRYGEQALWSSFFFPGGSAIANGQFPLFAVALNSIGQGFLRNLTIGETNMRVGGKIPQGRGYDVYGMTTEVLYHSTPTDVGVTNIAANTAVQVQDLLNIIDNGALAWRFNQAIIDVAPVSLVGAAGGAFGSAATTVDNVSLGHQNNGAGGLWLYQAHPVALPGGSQFTVLLRMGLRAAAISTNAIIVRVGLIGYYRASISVG